MALLEDIDRFLEVSYGSGDGDGSGYGSGSGSGYGDGSGYSYGDGSGDGDGDGDGSGYSYGDGSGYSYGDGSGDGLKSYNGDTVYYIDSVPTLIISVKGQTARGYIILQDLTTKPCYVAKCHDYFAHGDSIHEAVASAEEKYNDNKPVEDRIAEFVALYPSLDTVVTCSELFKAHNILTGSCEFGRRQFCQEQGIDIERDSMTVAHFIEITSGSYGGAVIKQLRQAYVTERMKGE